MPAHDDHTSQLFADAYSDLIEAAPDAPTLEEITTLSVDSSTGGKPPRKTSQIWVAVAAAAATVLVIGLSPLLVNNQGATPADTVVPTTLPLSTPTTLGEFVLIPGTWVRVSHDEAVFGGGDMSSVTVGGPGLVAVGEDGNGSAVWTSVDGVTWFRVPGDEAVFGAGDVRMSSVTVGGPGLVAVGSEGVPLEAVPDLDAVVWTSVDGVTWSRVPHDEEVFGAAFMSSVTAGGPGLVAVGGTNDAWVDGEAVVWTSVDGLTWSRVPHDEAVFGGEGVQVIMDVTVGGPGLVAVGTSGGLGTYDNNADNIPAVWTSVDGVSWSRVPNTGLPPVPETESLAFHSVATGGPGLVAVGIPTRLVGAAVWTSPDGITWTGVPNDATFNGAQSVTAGGRGLVAVGESENGSAVWTSVDGITWTPMMMHPSVGSQISVTGEVIDGGPGLVAIGTHSGDAAVWLFEED